MKDSPEVTPRIDAMARFMCLVFACMLGGIAATAYVYDGHALAYWLSGSGAMLFFVAGTVGPQSLRIGLVAWLPWF